jgi:hypothetical protein
LGSQIYEKLRERVEEGNQKSSLKNRPTFLKRYFELTEIGHEHIKNRQKSHGQNFLPMVSCV